VFPALPAEDALGLGELHPARPGRAFSWLPRVSSFLPDPRHDSPSAATRRLNAENLADEIVMKPRRLLRCPRPDVQAAVRRGIVLLAVLAAHRLCHAGFQRVTRPGVCFRFLVLPVRQIIVRSYLHRALR